MLHVSVVLAALAAIAEFPSEPSPRPPAAPRITVSKETTFITGPLRPDGTVDYAAALNERLGRGVTPENNFAVVLWQAVGPESVEKDSREAYFKLLGVAVPLEKGPYFQDIWDYEEGVSRDQPPREDFEKIAETLNDQCGEAEERSWTKEEFPEVAVWLASQEKPLDLIVEASRRPKYFSPLVSKGEPLAECFLRANDMHPLRMTATALRTRAMLRAGTGDVKAAREDLLACHRLARLKSQGPFLVDALVASSLENLACEAGAALAQSGRLSIEQLRKLQVDLAALGQLRSVADVMDDAERLFLLDSIRLPPRDPADVDIEGPLKSVIQELFAEDEKGKTLRLRAAGLVGLEKLDWDRALRGMNSQFDRVVGIMRTASRAERDRRWQEYCDDRSGVSEKAYERAKPPGAVPLKALSPEEAADELVGILTSPWMVTFGYTVHVDGRRDAVMAVSRLAVALAIYRAEHGKYPARLEELVPKCIAAIPADPLADGPLHYRVSGGGYVLYSVGVNGKDDGGRGWHDRQGEEPWDDIVVRTPRSPKRGAGH